MNKNQQTLSFWSGDDSPSADDREETVFLHAIAHQLCLRATYQRGQLIVAPHILYTRGEECFLDAVTIERNGERQSASQLETFRLAALKTPAITSEPFSPSSGFDVQDARYAEGVKAAVEE